MATETAPLHIDQLNGAAGLWRRCLRISLTDVFFVVMLFWMFLADPMGWDRLLWDGDTALHTRVGDFILDHGYVPSTDPFSFTKAGERFFPLQWLTGVVFAELNRWAGLKGIVLLCGVAIALYLALLARDMVQRGVNGMLALLLVMVGANASAIHYHARPHLFTLLFLTIGNSLIAADRARPSWRIWILAPLVMLWANMHSGFPAMLAVLALLVAGCALSREWVQVRRYALLLAACAAASLVNPNGIALHLHISQFLNSPWAMDNINEYQSPVFRSGTMYCYMGLLFLSLMSCAWHFARRRWTECLWILLFAFASLNSARHIPLFVITALPLIGIMLTDAWTELTRGRSRSSTLGVLAEISEKLTAKMKPMSVWTAVAIVGVILFADPQHWPQDLSAKYFPREVARQYGPQLAVSRVFTTDQWGDYLLWTGYPRQKVFFDGRSDFFGEQIGRDYVTVLEGRPGWRAVLDRYQVDMVLVPPETPLIELLSSSPGWRVLHRDRQSVLLARGLAGAAMRHD
jgi:hypothetical protein